MDEIVVFVHGIKAILVQRNGNGVGYVVGIAVNNV